MRNPALQSRALCLRPIVITCVDDTWQASWPLDSSLVLCTMDYRTLNLLWLYCRGWHGIMATSQGRMYCRLTALRFLFIKMQAYSSPTISVVPLFTFWGSCSSGYEELYLLGYNSMYSTESQVSFRKNRRTSLGTYFTLVSCLAYSSALKMEANYSYEKVGWLSKDFMAVYPRR
jgi:hypothetical protein